MVHLRIYTKPGCHLCDEMKEVVLRVLGGRDHISLEEIDISSDPALVERYGLEIPVLMIEGKKVAKFRVTEELLTRMLAGVGSGF
jgi:glutaredoxin